MEGFSRAGRGRRHEAGALERRNVASAPTRRPSGRWRSTPQTRLYPLRVRRRTLGRAENTAGKRRVAISRFDVCRASDRLLSTPPFSGAAVNWDWMRGELERWKKAHSGAPKVLNLFAYTGGASIACAASGAEVVHVECGKGHGCLGEGQRRGERAGQCSDPLHRGRRVKFVKREIRRGSRYEGIVMDPPSYGRGRRANYGRSKTIFTRSFRTAQRCSPNNPRFS